MTINEMSIAEKPLEVGKHIRPKSILSKEIVLQFKKRDQPIALWGMIVKTVNRFHLLLSLRHF